jgi:hypothetical protein
MTRRRVAVAALLLASALAACGDDGDGSGSAQGGVTTSAPPGDGSGGPGGDDGGPGDSTVPGGDPATTTGGGEPTTAGPGDPLQALDATGPVGSFAPDVLRPDRSQRVVLELHAVDGATPSQGVLDHLTTLVGAVTGKAVLVGSAGVPPGEERDWTPGELVDLADGGTVYFQGAGDAVLRLLFVHGTLQGDDSVLGVALRGDVAAIFVDRIESAAGLLGSSDRVARSVITHEIGHLLGLVDLHLATGREDPEHPGHSTNPNSVMYWAVESDLIGQLLGANPPDSFDEADRADLVAIAAGG